MLAYHFYDPAEVHRKEVEAHHQRVAHNAVPQVLVPWEVHGEVLAVAYQELVAWDVVAFEVPAEDRFQFVGKMLDSHEAPEDLAVGLLVVAVLDPWAEDPWGLPCFASVEEIVALAVYSNLDPLVVVGLVAVAYPLEDLAEEDLDT